MVNVATRTLWWSLVVSLLVYLLVAHVASVPSNPKAPVRALFVAFGFLSVATALGTLLYRRYALSGPIRRGDLDPTSREGQGRAFQPFILNLILSESVGIYGLVLAFLSGYPGYSIPFILGALALVYAHRPSAPDLVPPLSAGDSTSRPSPIK